MFFKGGKKHKNKNKKAKFFTINSKKKPTLTDSQMEQLLNQFNLNYNKKVEILGYVADRDY